MKRCPITYEEITEGAYSSSGLRRLSPRLPGLVPLPYSAEEQRREAALRADKMSVQGVQPKLSARLVPAESGFEIVDRGGRYILKPQHPFYPNLPENEDLTMRLAAAAGIEVPLHGMIWCKDDSLTYFVRRFDRLPRGAKAAVEDFAQLTGGTRDTKYSSSMERLIPVLDAHCTFPALSKLELLKRSLFCFLTGNEDMHLKNWSLITKDGKTGLSPAYDLLNSTLVLRPPTEEIALPLNGKKRRLRTSDWFDYWARDRLALPDRALRNVINTLAAALPTWHDLIDRSFLPPDQIQRYRALLDERAARIQVST